MHVCVYVCMYVYGFTYVWELVRTLIHSHPFIHSGVDAVQGGCTAVWGCSHPASPPPQHLLRRSAID